MTNRDLANATGLAAWIVANGYRPHMTRKMVLRLVWTDPAAPKPVPSAGSETVFSLSQGRCYLDPTADSSQARRCLGAQAHPDVVDGDEMARRIAAYGYASTMSQVTVLRLARSDPDFPETLTAGNQNQERLWSWTQAEPYWQARAYPPYVWVAAGPLSDPSQLDAVGAAPEMVTAEVAAQRLVDYGYVAECSRRQLLQVVRRDPSYLQLFRRIALPLTMPALIVTFVFEFRASWTDLMRPLIYLRDGALFTLPRGLKVILDRFGQGGEGQWEVVLAASVIATVPMLIILFLGQRYFVEGSPPPAARGDDPAGYQNDRSLPVSWLTRKLRKKKPK